MGAAPATAPSAPPKPPGGCRERGEGAPRGQPSPGASHRGGGTGSGSDDGGSTGGKEGIPPLSTPSSPFGHEKPSSSGLQKNGSSEPPARDRNAGGSLPSPSPSPSPRMLLPRSPSAGLVSRSCPCPGPLTALLLLLLLLLALLVFGGGGMMRSLSPKVEAATWMAHCSPDTSMRLGCRAPGPRRRLLPTRRRLITTACCCAGVGGDVGNGGRPWPSGLIGVSGVVRRECSGRGSGCTLRSEPTYESVPSSTRQWRKRTSARNWEKEEDEGAPLLRACGVNGTSAVVRAGARFDLSSMVGGHRAHFE
jgi:hypothetical protein